MSRYIDADAMKEWIDEYVSVFKKSDNKDIKGYIEHQPTIEAVPKEFHDKTCEAMAKRHIEEIANMPDIVRCRECRRQKSCVTFEGIADYDGYCSMGVRDE